METSPFFITQRYNVIQFLVRKAEAPADPRCLEDYLIEKYIKEPLLPECVVLLTLEGFSRPEEHLIVHWAYNFGEVRSVAVKISGTENQYECRAGTELGFPLEGSFFSAVPATTGEPAEGDKG